MQEFIQIHWCIFILLQQGLVLCRTLGLPEEEQQQEGEEAPPAPQQGIFYVHTDSIKYEQYIRVWRKFVIVIVKNINRWLKLCVIIISQLKPPISELNIIMMLCFLFR